jgi:hypothetical protein
MSLEIPGPKRRGAKKRRPSEQVLVHSCHDQSHKKQPENRACSDRISESAARRLTKNGLAQWLFFERCGKLLPNRKSIVLTPEAAERQAHTQDELNHKFALSINAFRVLPKWPELPPARTNGRHATRIRIPSHSESPGNDIFN